jgi:Leucine-rich repeat (LRR) protein
MFQMFVINMDNAQKFIDSLSNNVTSIDLSHRGLSSLPDITRFKNLKILYCSSNQLTCLPSLNITLEELYCYNNNLTKLPPLNENLKILDCTNNEITELPALNKKLQTIHCDDNRLVSVPKLFSALTYVTCYGNMPNLQRV